MKQARFSPKAGEDMDEILRFIAADNPEAADRVRETILNTSDFLANHPELGRRVRNATKADKFVRWFVTPKFRNFLIFYEPYRDTIVVLRVLHAAQDWTRTFPTE